MEKREAYSEVLGLDRYFTKEELNSNYKQLMTKIGSEDNTNNEVIKKAIVLNEAIHFLRKYATSEDTKAIYLEKLCADYGLTVEEAHALYRKQKFRDYRDIDEFLHKIESIHYDNSKFIRFTLGIMLESKIIWNIPVDKLISIYFSDNTDKFENFNSYVSKLVEVCNGIEKVVGIGNFDFDEAFNNFLVDKEKSFYTYLCNILKIKYYCSEIGEDDFKLQYRYDYETEEKFPGGFVEYLEKLYEMKKMARELGLSSTDLNENYKEYLTIDPKATKYEFLKDFYDARDICGFLPTLYMSYKEKYLSIPENTRTDFKSWINIIKIENETGLNGEGLVAEIFKRVQNAGYGNTIEAFLFDLIEANKNSNKNKEKKLS